MTNDVVQAHEWGGAEFTHFKNQKWKHTDTVITRTCPFASEIKDKLFSIIEESLDHPGSTHGSEQTLWSQWDHVDEFERLRSWIEKQIPDIIPHFKDTSNPHAYKVEEYWGMIYPSGTGTHAHSHLGIPLCAGYYVNFPEGSAPFVIGNKDRVKTIVPKEGDIIFFAGDETHSVPRGFDTKDRCMISFNIILKMRYASVFNVMCPQCNYEDVIYELNTYGCPKCNAITPKEDLLVKCE